MATRQIGLEKGNFKRSIDGILTAFTSLRNRKTEGNDPLKNAFYNIGLIALCFVLFGVLMILRPFIRPLVWGCLVAAALFPLKKKLAICINKWINKMESEETPVVIGILILPFSGLDKLGEFITKFTFTHIKVILMGLSSLIVLRFIVHYVPKEFFSGIFNLIFWLHSIFGRITSSLSLSMIFVLVICYLITIKLMWNPTTSNTFVIFGQSAWIFLVGYLCSFLGALQIPTFIVLMTYGLIGIYYDETNNNEMITKIKNIFKKKEEEKKVDREATPDPLPSQATATPMSRLMKTKTHLSEIKNKMQLNVPQESETKTKGKSEVALESDGYFKILFYACAATVLFKHLWIVFLSFIPITFYAIKSLCKALGIWNHIEAQLSHQINQFKAWFEARRYALIPIFLPGIIQLNKKLHKVFCSKLKTFVDDISASIMIVFLIVAAAGLSVFSFVQIYSEAITVAQLSHNLINRTLILNPELVESLPINMQNLNDVIDNAYQYSRGTIENYLDSALNGTNEEQAVKLKTQIISLFDRLVQSYMDFNNGEDVTIGPRVTSQSVFDTLDEIVSSSGGYSSIIQWAKSNLGVMKEVSESVLSIVMTNLSLVFSVFTTFFGLVIGSGLSLMTFLFNSIIFFTTLYYLLQSSQDRYVLMNLNSNSSGLRLVESLELSVSSVLVSTVKLSLFHGLFTWLTHTVFGAHVVYLPAFIASLLAAAPFLETYWCALPAFLDLWLSQDRFYLGILLVAIHFIVPPNFNTIIFSEIKGSGHPYLTALSIAGGIYLLGLEGAIIGPLLLCILIVLYDVTINSLSSPTPTTFTRQSSTDESNMLASPTDWEFAKRINESQLDSTI